MPEYLIVTYAEGMAILESLRRAVRYIASQYSDAMTPAEARAHFDARALLIRRSLALLDEMELEYRYGREGDRL
jgi:hypothetical protein